MIAAFLVLFVGVVIYTYWAASTLRLPHVYVGFALLWLMVPLTFWLFGA